MAPVTFFNIIHLCETPMKSYYGWETEAPRGSESPIQEACSSEGN